MAGRRRIRRKTERSSPEEYIRNVATLAEMFRKRMKIVKGVELRYKLDDLEFLDEYLGEIREKPPTEQLVLMLGAYFAEILRRAVGGEYRYEPERGGLSLRQGGVTCYPLARVRKACATKEKNPLQHYCFSYARRASAGV